MRKIDLENWDRREHYLFFRRADFAQYHIGFDVDVTHFLAATKQEGIPFSFAVTYAVTDVMNQMEAFRYRIHGEEVVLYETLHPSFAYLAPNMKYFKMVMAEMEGSMAEFAHRARAKALAQTVYFAPEEMGGRDDLIYISSVPRVAFTHLSHTIPASREDAVPRVSWGKYVVRAGKTLLPFNVQAHHSFVDGEDMGLYAEGLQRYFDAYAAKKEG